MQNLIPYVRQMVFAYVFVKGWIIDPYIQCFFYCSTEVLVLPPNYIEIINSDLVTTDVTMVKDWGGCLFWQWEKLEYKMVAFQNHRIFSLRCLKEDLIPVSVRLKSNITTPKAKEITRKAEKALLNERIRNINNTITMANTKRDTCMNTLLEVFPKEIMEECKMLINLRREAYYMKVKMRQIAKLEQLCHKNRGGCSNNKDGRYGREDTTVPVLTSNNNEKTDGTIANIKNRWVVNLSGQPLTEAEYRVLTHGPNFAIRSRTPHGRMYHCH